MIPRGVCAVSLLLGTLSCADILGIVPGEPPPDAAGGQGGSGGSGGSGDSTSSGGQGGVGGALGPALTLQWAQRWGATTDEHVAAVTVDGANRVVIAGSYRGAWQIAPAPMMTNGGGEDLFAAKIDADESAVWAYGWGAEGDQLALGVAQRNEPNGAHQTYVTGFFDGHLQFPNGTDNDMQADPDDYDGFVTRIGDTPNSSGQNQCFRFIGPGIPTPGPIAVVQGATKQNLLITGHTDRDLGIAGTTIYAQDMQRGFLARIFGGGDDDWAIPFGVTGTQHPRGIAVDNGNNVTVVGSFTGVMSFGAVMAMPSGGEDAFVLRVIMDTDTGDVRWLSPIGTTGSEVAHVVAATPSQGAVVAGTFSSDVVVGDTMLTVSEDGDPDVFLARYDGDGNVLWATNIASSNLTPRALVYRSEQIYLGADLDQGQASFPNGVLESAGIDIVVAIFDGDGTPVEAQLFGDVDPQAAEKQTLSGMTLNSVGNLILAGDVEGSLDMAGMPLTSVGGKDVFIAELSPRSAD